MSEERRETVVRMALSPQQIAAVTAASMQSTPRQLIEIERGISSLQRAAALFLSISVRESITCKGTGT